MKKRILFVDDEQRVLDGLRRSLRRYRDRWDTSFADGGEAAKLELENSHFDVVVSDMRMPGMDGFTFLSHVRQEYPDTVRIVLSGQTERETALKSVSVSHQFLAKPCEGNALREVLDRACAVRDLCANPRLRSTISRLGALPSPPKVYLALTQAMADEDTSAGDIGEIIEKDMAMSVKILQIVNSAYFGLPREVSSIRDAVSFLGQNMIRALVLSQEAFSSFEGNEAFTTNDLKLELEHAMLTGAVARGMFEDAKVGDQAFLAGMLHDIGVLILATQFPDDLLKLAALEDSGMRVTERERQLLDTTHAEIGAFLLGTWGLPIRVTEAVAFHHDPTLVDHTEFDIVTAVHVADAFVSEMCPTTSPIPRETEIDMAYIDRLGIRDELPTWRKAAAEVIANHEGESDD
ncbi:MAG: HD-like signal output (HDOD) protein [Chlamydiales bacterium]|jgi:HD-like signal output (HDOD) protein